MKSSSFTVKENLGFSPLSGRNFSLINILQNNDSVEKKPLPTPYLFPTFSAGFSNMLKIKKPQILLNSRLSLWARKDLNLRPADYETVGFVGIWLIFQAFGVLPTYSLLSERSFLCFYHSPKNHLTINSHMR